MKYKTKKIDYTGCDPIIAEHLKRGEAILCKVGNQEEYIESFFSGSARPYIDSTGEEWESPSPIEQRQRVKKASEIIKWLEDNGYELNSIDEYIHFKTNTGWPLSKILKACREELDMDCFPEEWLEDY